MQMQISATQPTVAPTIIAVLVVVVAVLLLSLLLFSLFPLSFAGFVEVVKAASGVAVPVEVVETDWVSVWEGGVSVVAVREVCCGVGSGIAAVLGEAEGVGVVVKALYSSVLAGLSAQAR